MSSGNRYRWPGILAAVVGVLAVVGIGLLLRGRSHSGAAPAPRLARGAPIGRYLNAAGVDPDSVSGRYGALVYLGSALAADAHYLSDALDSLRSHGIDVFLILPTGAETVAEDMAIGRVLEDPGGRFGSLLRADPASGAYLVFDKKTLWCRAARTGAPLQMLREELILIARELASTWTAAAGNVTPSGPFSDDSLTSVPWDELLSEAVVRHVDVDRLETRPLRLLRSVGGKAYPKKGELALARPWSVAADERGHVLVCDGDLHKVAVLDSAGMFLAWLAPSGQGPGELQSPSRVVAHGDRILVAETCCKLHEFDAHLRWVRSAYWPAEILPTVPFDALGPLVLAELVPAPPDRVNLVYAFEWGESGLEPVGSFLCYAAPSGKYAKLYNAVLSRNTLSFRTDGRRYLVLCRVGEPYFTLVDVAQKTSWRFVLRGANVRTRPRRPSGAPPYAYQMVVRDFAFDNRGHLFALVRGYGILLVNLSSAQVKWLYRRVDLPYPDSHLQMYTTLALRDGRAFLLSPYLAKLDICSIGL